MLGEEAREYGLKISLQERLQHLYKKLDGLALKHMVTLDTNYRCHKSIIDISNRLFYESKIWARSESALPHPKAEFPLLFVCSSLTEEVDHEYEAKLMVEKMEDFVLSNWPTDTWGERDWSKICLTTTTRTQVFVTSNTVSFIYLHL